MSTRPILIDGQWQVSAGTRTFRAVNPATREPLADAYPVSPREELERVVKAADRAFRESRDWPGERFARFLEKYAELIEVRRHALVATANDETALPVQPRLAGNELPRTVSQLRQAAAAAREGSWALPTIDVKA